MDEKILFKVKIDFHDGNFEPNDSDSENEYLAELLFENQSKILLKLFLTILSIWTEKSCLGNQITPTASFQSSKFQQ